MNKPSIGLREAKANLSKLIRKVEDGAEIILTNRGKPVAKLSPVEKDSLSLEQRLSNIEDAGWIDPPKNIKRKLPFPIPLTEGKAQEYLQEDRSK